MSGSPMLAAYRAATWALTPFAGNWLRRRARAGKEDEARLPERFGQYRQVRPDGVLIWLHAASVGESNVALALAEALAAHEPDVHFLISSGTRTSAELIARRAPARTLHVYAPIDRASIVRRFLAHWRPDLGVFVESELWPHLILQAHGAGVPLALVNARMSPSSLARWTRWRAAGASLLKRFAWVSAADARTARALSDLRGADVPLLGNLKLAAPAPRVDHDARAALVEDIGARPVWLAASTHAGEDEIALAAHALLRAEFPDALLIIAPRHPERGADVAALAGDAPRRAQMRGVGAAPIYIADTLGEMGVLYDLAPAALVAGSLLPHLKGHNPAEPAKLGAAIVSGPYVESFEDLFAELFAAAGAIKASGAREIAAAIAALWRDEGARTRQAEAARAVVARGADAFDVTVNTLPTLLTRAETRKGAHAPA